MTRRQLLALALASPLGRAQRYRTYSTALPEFVTRLAREAYERRNAALVAVTTPEAVRARQRWARETFWRLTGGNRGRTPLNVRVTGGFERPGYRLEKLYYESQPGLYIAANLYIPTTGTPPYPGVLFQMGHAPDGKAYGAYQKCCQGLARLGYMVLAFDPMGQGERQYYSDAKSADDQHTRAAVLMLPHGDTATRMQTWDAVRSLDVLAAHPLVDPKRLASTGQSGGGTLTMFLAAVDDRLACAAVSSGNTENFACAGFLAPGSVDDGEQNFLNAGPAGFDRWDTLWPLAPKPLLVLVSAKDFFGTYTPNYLTSGREEFSKLRAAYTLLGAEDRIEWGETPLPHALSHDLRVRIYNFFERRLKGSTRPVAEPQVRPEPEEALVVGLPRGKTPDEIAREFPGRVRIEPRVDAPLSRRLEVLARANAEACTIEAAEVQSARDVWVPAWIYRPRVPSGRTLLALHPAGRNARWREGDEYHRLAGEGVTVCAFDVRGIGDLRPPRTPKEPVVEDPWWWASHMLGMPLAGQQATDILSIARALPGALELQAPAELLEAVTLAAARETRLTIRRI